MDKQLKIIDFGTARDLSLEKNVKVMVGTPEFIGMFTKSCGVIMCNVQCPPNKMAQQQDIVCHHNFSDTLIRNVSSVCKKHQLRTTVMATQ